MTARAAPGARTRERGSRTSTLAWVALAIVVPCGAAALMAGPGYRLGGWSLGTGLQIVRWAATVAAVASVLALAAVALGWRMHDRRTVVAGLAGMVLGLAVAGPPFYLSQRVRDLPRIHDVSTDTTNPPRFVAVLPLRKGASNSVEYGDAAAAAQRVGYPQIGPAVLRLPPAQALRLAEQAARAMGWEIVAVAPEDGRIEATDTTSLFGFKDDIVIRVTPDGTGSRVDVRSLSRIGASDFGTNAHRVRAFVGRLNRLVQS
jgi:uncharacterized protein (DUF1499 family)